MLSPRALIDIPFAKSLTDLNEDAVVELIEEGLIYPAWNICCSTAAHRREIRILSAGLTYYAGTQMTLPADAETVCENLVPPDAPCNTVTLQKTLNCSRQLVQYLLKAKTLKLAPGEKIRRGRGPTAKIDRQSVIQFLKERLI